MKISVWLQLVLPLVLGCGIGWMDTRPHWDDTGITVGAIFISGMISGILIPKFWLLSALLIGVSVTIMNYAVSGSFAASVSIIISFIACFTGRSARTLFFPPGPTR